MVNLRSFEDVVREIAERHGLPFEKVEQILIDWMAQLYYDVCSMQDQDTTDILNRILQGVRNIPKEDT